MNTIFRAAAVVSAALFSFASTTQAATLNLSQGNYENSSAVLIAEQSNVQIGANDVLADYVVGANLDIGDYFSGRTNVGTTHFLDRGRYNSHLIHFDPMGAVGGADSATFSFASDIAAIIVSNSDTGNASARLLNVSDDIFGNDTTTYEKTISRRAEDSDGFKLTSSNSLFFSFQTSSGWTDSVRVLTVSEVPLPAGAALMLTAMGAFGVMRKMAARKAA